MAPARTWRDFLAPVLAGYCGLLIGVGMGRFGYPPLIPAMVEAGWATPTELHLAGAFNLAGYIVGAGTALATARAFGVRPAIALAALVSVLSFALSAIPLPGWAFIALRALSGATGGVLMIVIPPVIANAVAPSHKGRASGLAFAGVGTGFVLSGTAVPAFAASGPAPAWLALAAVLAVASVVMLALLPRSAPPQAARRGDPAPAWRREPAFLGLAAAYCGAAVGYVPHTIFFVDHVARDLGFGLAVGGWIWVAAGITAVCAPMVAGIAADRFGYARVLRVIVALMAIGAAIPALSHNLALLTLSAMMAGGLMIGLGASTAGRTREIVGAEAHTAAWALQTVAFAIVQAAAAYAFTALLASTSSHSLVFALAAAIMASGLAAELATARQPRKSGP
ncbi:YbfB/YjiJ family MFS transporter [Phreatobacter sp.]|uniref:YbfB/YjiJ family MFS transporter n=1 Tax=Phreatobacter sp. TaxID=1966341 RepID=UPI003F71C65C